MCVPAYIRVCMCVTETEREREGKDIELSAQTTVPFFKPVNLHNILKDYTGIHDSDTAN